MNVKSMIGLAAATLMMAACQSNTYHIKGEAKHLKNGTHLYLSADLKDGRPIDTLDIQDGRFNYYGMTDSAFICRLYQAGDSHQGILFFVEPGNIYIELSQKPGLSRVSGTRINNEWQALNDRGTTCDHEIRSIMGNARDSISPKKLSIEMNRLYDELTARIQETALRNKDNALGHFISKHFNTTPSKKQ